ncbi:MAG: DNA primase [Clostridia bacterium]|nr:DNA primase [Clostridia bacterium]MBT7122383.1 DNA primase [Clostridia bacterium]
MARFTDNWLSELYSKNDIVDVVSEYTTLTERGGRYWGLCPFHSEKTPSFSVSRDKQLYYCFGCKGGGNVTNFIMKTENVTFPEAVERLAKRANMEMQEVLEDKQYKKITQKKKTIVSMNKIAAQLYYDTLHSPVGKEALSYLKRRGIDENSIKRFGLGFAPDDWSTVTDLLKKEGFKDEDIKDSGLVSVKNNNMFDTFRNRVMFPIINTFGDVIAFGGRVMDDSTPKYLNTKETAAFNKRRNLYGIDLIRKMKGIKGVVIVEGYMDVVSLSAHGVKAAVASLGTAFTRQQAMLIKRYTSDVFVAYDGDSAGQIATMKALDILSGEGLNVRVVQFADGEDPDDFIRKNELAGFAKKVKHSLTAIGYKLDVKKREFDMKTEDGREGYAIAAAKIIGSIDSPIKQERYIARIAEQTGYSEHALSQQIQGASADEKGTKKSRITSINKSRENIENVFLAFAMANPQYVVDVAHIIKIDDFSQKTHKNIFSVLYECIKRGVQPTYAELVSELETEEDTNEAARLAEIDTVASDPRGYMIDCANKMSRHVQESKRSKLLDQMQDATSEQRKKLLAEIGEIDKELRDKSGGVR